MTGDADFESGVRRREDENGHPLYVAKCPGCGTERSYRIRSNAEEIAKFGCAFCPEGAANV